MRLDRVAAWVVVLSGLTGPMTAVAQTASADGTDELSFRAADQNWDGRVDEAELAADLAKRFLHLDANRDGLLAPGELAEHDPARFAALDANGDGRLSFDEVMGEKLQDFGRADVNHDGRLSYDEVVRYEGGG
jgi:hypothetical protein